MEARISSRSAPIDTSLSSSHNSTPYKTPTHLPTPLKLEFELRKFYIAEPNSITSPDTELDPRLQSALHRIQELESENKLLRAAQCPKCSHSICNMTDPLEGVMSQANFLKEQYLELRKEYHNYRVRNPPPAKTPTSGSSISKAPSLSVSETSSYASVSEAATSPSSSPHTSLIKQRSIENWRTASMEVSHSPPLDELTLVDEGEELGERETPTHSRKASEKYTPNQLSPNRKKSQHKVRSFHYSKAFIKLLGVDPFNRPISTSSSSTHSSNSSLNYSDTRDLTTRSWCVPPQSEAKGNSRSPQSASSTRSFLIRRNSNRFSGLWALGDEQQLTTVKAKTLPRRSNHLRPPSIRISDSR